MSLLNDLWSWIADHRLAASVAVWVLLSVGIVARWVIARRRRTSEIVLRNDWRLPSLEVGPNPYDDSIQAAARGRDDRDEPLAAISDGRDPPPAQEALEIEAGQLVYQIPENMWRDTPETIEVRLGLPEAEGIGLGFVGSGEIKTTDTPIVETMTVDLWSLDEGAFLITRKHSDAQQFVKRDKLKGTALQGDDFGRWRWVVTPKQTGVWMLYVTISAGLTDSRGVPVTTSLPVKTFPVKVRVHMVRATIAALGRAIPSLAWVVVTSLVGIFTRDYWWPFVRDWVGLG
jgi:hypothetical protein